MKHSTNVNPKKGHIKKEERLHIFILLGRSCTHREIGSALGRSHTSIGREIKNNSTNGIYDPHKANAKARLKRKLSKFQGMKVESITELENYIKNKLECAWTPEQIAGRLKEVDTHIPHISHMGIYKWLYSSYGQAYCKYLPKHRYIPKKRKGKKKGKREIIPNRIGIEKRSKKANERKEYGHFEGDTVVSGKKHKDSASLTVVSERKARYVGLKKIKNLKPKTNNKAVRKILLRLFCKSLSLDNGIENKHHEKLKKSLNIDTYFCDPYSSWQKGGVENINKRIRRFIPKGANISDYSDKEIQIIEDYLNHTPRKCLNYKTPYEVMIENNLFTNKNQPSGAIEGLM